MNPSRYAISSRTYTTGAVRFYSQRSGVPGLPSRPQLRRIAEINKGPILDTSREHILSLFMLILL
jgi:hypothetical protein